MKMRKKDKQALETNINQVEKELESVEKKWNKALKNRNIPAVKILGEASRLLHIRLHGLYRIKIALIHPSMEKTF